METCSHKDMIRVTVFITDKKQKKSVEKEIKKVEVTPPKTENGANRPLMPAERLRQFQ